MFFSLFFLTTKAQSQSDIFKLGKLFNETDLTAPGDSYQSTFVDEGDLYILEVMHLPKRLQSNTLNKILILSDSALYSTYENKIIRYAYDIYHVYGCEIKMKVIKGETYIDVKNVILSDSTDLDGVVFIGDIASAWYEANDLLNYNIPSIWPCDMYYMDLDAVWNDLDHDNYFENYDDDFNPEIFVGRICTDNVINETGKQDLFEQYMDKNHAFWIGHRPVNKEYALSYTNPTWNDWPNDYIHGIQYLYGQNKYDAITSDSVAFCADDYLERLRNDKYEFIQLCSHSDVFNHYFDSLVPTGPTTFDTTRVTINKSKIYSNGCKAIGMNLYCCSACRWTTLGFLGGAYVYGPNSSVLSLIGSSKPGSLLDMPKFYEPLNDEKTMGQAFVDWWRSDLCYEINRDSTICWFFGLTIIGDPLVNFFHCTNSTCQDNLTLTSYNSSLSPVSYYLTSESITVAPPSSGSFTIPVGDHCILNAPTVLINGAFLCPQGSTMEILNEGCRDNCDE